MSLYIVHVNVTIYCSCKCHYILFMLSLNKCTICCTCTFLRDMIIDIKMMISVTITTLLVCIAARLIFLNVSCNYYTIP